MTMPAIQLQLIPHQMQNGMPYQHLRSTITTEDGLIEPQNLKGLELPEITQSSQGVVIEGKGPIWLYSYLAQEYQASAWIGCYDPRLGIVVVATHTPSIKVGTVFPVQLPA